MERERWPWPETQISPAQWHFNFIVQYLRRLETDTDLARSRINRTTARAHAGTVLDMSSEQRREVVNSFKKLAHEDQQMARAVYQTFRSTRVLPVSELRQFLGLPQKGPLFPKQR